jgi:hypothetical protein
MVEVPVTEIPGTLYILDVPPGGMITPGVRAKYVLTQDIKIDGIDRFIGETIVSEINWSDVNGLETPNPFVLFEVVEKPKGLRIQ